MRLYFAGGVDALQQLRDGNPVSLPVFQPASEDEQDEFDALVEAAEHGDVVIAADVVGRDSAVSLDRVASFHVDVDDSGDMAWFARQELDQVIELLNSAV